MVILGVIAIIFGIINDAWYLWPAIGFAGVGLVMNMQPDENGKRLRHW